MQIGERLAWFKAHQFDARQLAIGGLS